MRAKAGCENYCDRWAGKVVAGKITQLERAVPFQASPAHHRSAGTYVRSKRPRMEIRNISEVLAPLGLGVPKLTALLPNVDNYTAQLLQPHGEIEATAGGVRNRSRELATLQFRTFLEKANIEHPQIAITPEYSLPWDVLKSAVVAGVQPRLGELWVLGCESISYAGLLTAKEELRDVCAVGFEELAPDNTRFLSPLAYVFHAPLLQDPERHKLVIIVQFKTHPMSDPGHFEVSGLQRGCCIYEFHEPSSVRLVSLICSDALDFLDQQAQAVYDRALIIHIQLNPKPRHEEFRRYRDRLLRYEGDSTEIICLNWARDVRLFKDHIEHRWRNVAGSAWYLRPSKFDDCDETLVANHRRGLYYTWLKPFLFHAVFFNYQPGIFVVEASKVFQVTVPGVIARRKGPQLRTMLSWNADSAAWVATASIDDEFSKFVEEAGDARDDLQDLSTRNPLFAERILALSVGKAGVGINWHGPRRLDSLSIDGTEIIKRMTFCQDNDPRATEFRSTRLRRCRELMRILKQIPLPPNLSDFSEGFHLDWSPASAQQNLRSTSGEWATVIYMGEDSSKAVIEAAFKAAADNLHKASSTADESISAKQRLVVWYKEDDQLRIFGRHEFVSIDKPDNISEVDIGRSGI
jgi:hypothetical protein